MKMLAQVDRKLDFNPNNTLLLNSTFLNQSVSKASTKE